MARLAFFGTPEFSLPTLRAIERFASKFGHSLALVVTQPDARQGRGKMLDAPPVKKLALELGVPVLQPESLRKNNPIGEQFYRDFVAARIDLALVVAYGKIIPQRILSAAQIGFVNIHASLLPRFRGAAPVQRALEAGDEKTGVCLMDMVLKLDEGDVFACRTTPIIPSDTSTTLFRRLSFLGADLLYENLDKLIHKQLSKQPQSEHGIVYASMLNKDEGAFRPHTLGQTIANRARAFDPWPTLYGFINQRRVMFFDSFFIATATHADKIPGTIVVANNFLGVRALDGLVYFQSLQIEGKKRMPVKEALKSLPIKIGDQISHFST